MNVEYIIAGDEKVDFRGALEEINNRYKINNVRVDSGGTLNGILLRAGLVDEVSVLIHPFLVGGMTPSSLFRAADLISTEGVISLKVIKINLIEPDLIWMRFEVLK